MPDFEWEEKLWKKGFRIVAGADEVGRGAWAGPIVASVVAWPRNFQFPVFNFQITINDSKKLTAKQREEADAWTKSNCLAWGVGEVSVATVNRLGIVRATNIAFRKAIKNCNGRLQTTGYRLRRGNSGAVDSRRWTVDFLLIDAFYVPYTKGLPLGRKNARKNPAAQDSRARQKAIIKGDSKSFSIAAASIIAKVHRDRLMDKLSKNHKKYLWDKNKGYGTKEHKLSIVKYGLTRLHRKVFVRNLMSK